MVADDDSGSGGECPAASRSAVVGRAGGTRTAQRGRSARRWAQVLSAIIRRSQLRCTSRRELRDSPQPNVHMDPDWTWPLPGCWPQRSATIRPRRRIPRRAPTRPCYCGACQQERRPGDRSDPPGRRARHRQGRQRGPRPTGLGPIRTRGHQADHGRWSQEPGSSCGV